MFFTLTRWIGSLILPVLLVGCVTVNTSNPLPTGHQAAQALGLEAALASIQTMDTVDAVIRLDNQLFGRRLQDDMNSLADLAEVVEINSVQVQFDQQYIALSASGRLKDDHNETRDVRLRGIIDLRFAAGQLVWRPHFSEIQWASETAIDPELYVPPPSGSLLEALNSKMARDLEEMNRHFLAIDPLALGRLEAGAVLTRLANVTAEASLDLGGVFTTQASAFLVEPEMTSIALDLNFVSSAFTCPANVSVSRALFTREINNREPAVQSTLLQKGEDIQYFFTEVTGANESTAVVHYWFADGQPASVKELPVEPSARWRTWSSRPDGFDDARTWEVLVVEKGSGCILELASAFTDFDATDSRELVDRSVIELYKEYRAEFLERLTPELALDTMPALARIDVRRDFFIDVLAESLRDQELQTHLPIIRNEGTNYEANLAAFDANNLQCNRPQCKATRECVVDYDDCPIERDNRDCTSCLFRNPLNNRCVNEAQDPICEAAKSTRNTRLAQARESCIQNAQEARDACELRKSQYVRTCELEASTEISACQSRLALMRDLGSAGAIARVEGNAAISGELDVTFHGFQLEDDLESLRMDIGLRANLGVDGRVDFQPIQGLGQLASCIDRWEDRFQARIRLPGWQGGLISRPEPADAEIRAEWSGFVHRVEMRPSPLESMFVANPGRLADCQLGLGIDHVSSALNGPQSGFFKGDFEFFIQPLPTVIQFHTASLNITGNAVKGTPRLEAARLVYEFEN